MTRIVALQNDWLVDRDTTKKNIRRIIREWKPVLDMTHWTFEVTFYKDKYTASCYAEPEYRKGYLNLYLGKLLEKWKTNYELEEFVVHEMLHCLTWSLVTMTERLIVNIGDNGHTKEEMWKLKEDHEELFVQRMSDALVMQKYGLRSIPDSIRFRAARRDRRQNGFSKPKRTRRTI